MQRVGALRLLAIGIAQPTMIELRVPADKERATVAEVLQLLRDQQGPLVEGQRASIIRMNGHILPQQEQYNLRAEDAWWLLIEPVRRTTAPPDLNTQAKDLVKLSRGRLRLNQVKLLLRGEDGLAVRLHRQRLEEARNTFYSAGGCY